MRNYRGGLPSAVTWHTLPIPPCLLRKHQRRCFGRSHGTKGVLGKGWGGVRLPLANGFTTITRIRRIWLRISCTSSLCEPSKHRWKSPVKPSTYAVSFVQSLLPDAFLNIVGYSQIFLVQFFCIRMCGFGTTHQILYDKELQQCMVLGEWKRISFEEAILYIFFIYYDNGLWNQISINMPQGHSKGSSKSFD